MTQWLKLSTATTVQFGPFVDKTDGVTLETGLASAMDNATTGIRVSKNGAAFADRNSSTVPAYDAMGCYRVELDATDTNTLGRLRIIFEEAATCLPAWMDFMVVPANIYDSLVLQTDTLDTNITQIAGGTVPTPASTGVPDVNLTHWKDTAAAAVDTAGYPKVTIKSGAGAGEINTTAGVVENVTTVGTCTTNTDMRGTDSAATAAELATVKTSTDFINTTAISELAAAAPSATPTIKDGLMLLYMWLRNNTSTTGSGGTPASSRRVRNNAGSTIATATITEDANETQQGKLA